MPLLEDKSVKYVDYKVILKQFSVLLMDLLKSYEHNQKYIAQLLKENESLKKLLNTESHQLSKKEQEQLLSLNNKKSYITQIDTYIKNIEDCLAYFEQ